MEAKFKANIIAAIEQGDYRFARDKLGNNYLLVLPMRRSQVEIFELVATQSFPSVDRNIVLENFDKIVKSYVETRH
jgi:hypothetical protein